MAISVTNWVWSHSKSRHGARLVLLFIADSMRTDGGWAWPSNKEIASKTALTGRAVTSALTDLAKLGELEIQYNGGPKGCNRYRVLTTPEESSPPKNLHPEESSPSGDGASSQARVQNPEEFSPPADFAGVKISTPAPEKSAPGTIKEPKPKNSPSESSAVAGAPTAQTILASFIDWVRGNDGSLTKRTIGHLAKQIGDLLAQGQDDRHIRKGLADWFLAGQHSSTLDSFVNAAMNADARNRAAQEVRQQPSSHAPESTGTIRARAAMEAGRRVQAMLDERNRP